MKAFPLFINVANRSVIVFGGSEEAAAKLRLLLKTEATVIAMPRTSRRLCWRLMA